MRAKIECQRSQCMVLPVPGEIEIPDLFAALRDLLAQVPAGRVTTYGALATALGDVKAARWVATCLLDPLGADELPAHRVVLKDGRLGQFRAGRDGDKSQRLQSEGVAVRRGIVDLAEFGFTDFRCSQPLARLKEQQSALFSQLDLTPPERIPDRVGGVDVSYIRTSDSAPSDAVAAFVVVETATGDLISSRTLRRPARFPYIPGYLAFRELPVLLELIASIRDEGQLPEVTFVDGNGILHHRHAGIATQLGIAAGIATIGVGKSLLCGKVDLDAVTPDEPQPVVLEGRTVASALRANPRSRPIFVSPGHRTDVTFAARLARRLIRGHRVPEPIYWAHTVSRDAAAVYFKEVNAH